jgi:hypothetical protein
MLAYVRNRHSRTISVGLVLIFAGLIARAQEPRTYSLIVNVFAKDLVRIHSLRRKCLLQFLEAY